MTPPCPACFKPFSKEEGKALAAWHKPYSYRCPHCGVDVEKENTDSTFPNWWAQIMLVLIVATNPQHSSKIFHWLQTDSTTSTLSNTLMASPLIYIVWLIYLIIRNFRNFHWTLKPTPAE